MAKSKPITADQTGTLQLLYDVSRELASALDLRTVLQRVLFLSIKHTGAVSGSILVMDEDGEPLNSAIIHRGEVFSGTTEQLRSTLDAGLAGWVMRNREPALVLDTSKDKRWEKREYADNKNGGPRSTVSVPLLVRDELVGVMTLTHTQTGAFGDEHLDLVQSIADQAAIAALNARLFDQAQRRADVMAALAQSAASINASLELEDVLQRILDQTSQALGAEAVSLALVDVDSGELEFRAGTGLGRDEILGLRVKVGQGVVGWVAEQGEGVVVRDVSKDERFFKGVDELTGHDTQAIVAAPIRVKGTVIGVVEAINPQIDNTTLNVLEGIGNLAGSAISHARVFTQAEVARRRYLELFEDTVDPVLITNTKGQVIEANRRAVEFTGFSREELEAMNIADLHTPDHGVLGKSYAKLKGDNTLSYESALICREGDPIPVEAHVHRVLIEDEQRFQWLLRDLRDRKELDKMREDLLSMVYHDLRSPLSNVISGLDLLGAMLPLNEDPSLKSVFDVALRSTERVQRLTNSLLDIARMENGQQIANLKKIELVELVKDTLEAVMHGIENKRQYISLDLPPGKHFVNVDEDMVRRVIINLVENAMKYNEAGTRITLGAKAAKKGLVELSVSDDGKGIAEADQARIFAKFERAEGYEETPKGLGLGLAFCKLAVEAHGGRIWVESAPGKGASFKFTVPAAK
jgi:PAS domain S-box-containing protein